MLRTRRPGMLLVACGSGKGVALSDQPALLISVSAHSAYHNPSFSLLSREAGQSAVEMLSKIRSSILRLRSAVAYSLSPIR